MYDRQIVRKFSLTTGSIDRTVFFSLFSLRRVLKSTNFGRWSQFSRPAHKKQRDALVYKFRSARC